MFRLHRKTIRLQLDPFSNVHQEFCCFEDIINYNNYTDGLRFQCASRFASEFLVQFYRTVHHHFHGAQWRLL